MKFIQAISLFSILAPPWWSTTSVLVSAKNEFSQATAGGATAAPVVGHRRALGATKCTLLTAEKVLVGGRTEHIVACEGPATKIFEVNFLPDSVISTIDSGVTELVMDYAVENTATNEINIPVGAGYELDNERAANVEGGAARSPEEEWPRRRLIITGNKEVLVVREARTESTAFEISDEIFGTNGDTVNLAKQYSACSYGQLTFSPVVGDKVTGGVLTVSIETTNNVIVGNSDGVIREKMKTAARDELNGGYLGADYVMLCIPPGTDGNWIAYAYINYWLSVYNNKWCNFPSGQMHELGHNFGMAHAGEGGGPYADQSGMMGYSYDDDTTNMCFNGPKTYQLGWFSNYHVDISGSNTFSQQVDLVGFVERDSIQNQEEKMIIRITPTIGGDDYYIHFNRDSGFNDGTKEGQNQVLVAKRGSGLDYKQSWLMAKLNANGQYVVSGFNGNGFDLIITVGTIDLNISPSKAAVTVEVIAPTPAPISLTPAPVAPTPAPVAPTPAPVDPTLAPISPTLAPIAPTPAPAVPTPAPVSPTPAPVVPTTAPVVPTPAPVSPTSAPVASTLVPVAPNPAPVAPTPAPVASTPAPGTAHDNDWQSCDDKEGVFLERTIERTCNWLSFRGTNRINRVCADVNVRDLCVETCGVCTDECEDDTEALFQINNRIGEKTCRWVSVSTERITEYCHPGHTAFFHCRETCESCDEKYDVFPSAAPSGPVIDPLADGECKDNDLAPFLFGTVEKYCPWLRRQNEVKQAKLCVEGDDAYYACEATCGFCTRTVLEGDCNNNDRCDVGENCESCPNDCRVRHHATNGFCCVGGECEHRGCNRSAQGKQWDCLLGPE